MGKRDDHDEDLQLPPGAITRRDVLRGAAAGVVGAAGVAAAGLVGAAGFAGGV